MLNTITEIVLDAGKMLQQKVDDDDITIKSSSKDLVTIYDKQVQEFLYSKLSKAFPEAGFLGEEGLNKPNNNGTFIIDPIDGTTNFIKGLNHSAISVGYCKDRKMKYGVVYNPFNNELFTAEKGHGATLNGKSIHTTNNSLDKSVAIFGTAAYYPEFNEITYELVLQLQKLVIDVRRFGAASLDFCYVACGRSEIFVEYALQPWDIAAGSLIASEAGAIVSSMDGKELQFNKITSVIAANKETYYEILKTVSSFTP